jgi:hypothetical protein
MTYTVKNVKTFIGNEGQGFNASLCRDGIKIAFVFDDANGGCYSYQWEDGDEPQVDIHITSWEEKPMTYKGTPEEKLFREFIETLPKVKSDLFPEGLRVSDDMFMDDLINNFTFRKAVLRSLKKNYLYQVGKNIGSTEEYQTIKREGVTKAMVIAYIEKKYPKQKYKIFETESDL